MRTYGKSKFVINSNFTGCDKGRIVGTNLLVRVSLIGHLSMSSKVGVQASSSLALRKEKGNNYL